jgi:DNA invertase Pin-like site-specific DNA recombinase
MNGSMKIQAGHLERQAVVYLRQSSPKQVLHNRESAVNQRALRERLIELGWPKNRVSVIDEDQGLSGKQSAGRDGFKKLAADVALGKIGIVMGYEASRVARNCADWYRLLELAAIFDTLIGDADGIYNPRDYNDRLLLGLKGTMSEAELHSLRLRLDAGRISKAKRGELIQWLPTGYVRQADGTACLDPDQSIQDRIRLIFAKFRELGSVQKVLRYFVRHGLKIPRRQMSGPRIGEVLWKAPSMDAIRETLKNPAYAGIFVHGRRSSDPTRQVPGRPGTGRPRQPVSRWVAFVKSAYPAYISWEEQEQIQQTIAKNWQAMLERMSRKGGKHATAPLLVGLVRCGHCGRAMRVAYKGRGIQYVCSAAQSQRALPSCQFLSGVRIDKAVVQEFFRALQPAEIDALERVGQRQAEHHRELLQHLEQEVTRLEYAAHRAERQYNCVDPENRLIASALEKKWENALADLEQARSRLRELQDKTPQEVAIPVKLREELADVGRHLPEAWSGLSVEARRRLLRTLIQGVNLRRDNNGIAQVRIVWQGGLVTETAVAVPVSSLRFSDREQQIIKRIKELVEARRTDQQIAEQLNAEKYLPCRGGVFTWRIVLKMRRRHGLRLRIGQVREGNLAEGYTIRELATLLGVDTSWFYGRITDKHIEIAKHPAYGCYLFPRNPRTVQQLQRLKNHEQEQVSFPTEHSNG